MKYIKIKLKSRNFDKLQRFKFVGIFKKSVSKTKQISLQSMKNHSEF